MVTRVGRTRLWSIVITMGVLFFLTGTVSASTPSAGGNTTVVSPSDESAISITEDAVQPESANIRLIVPTLSDPAGGTPSSIRIISVTSGTLWTSGGSSITLGAAGTILSLTTGKLDLRFRPDAGRDTAVPFSYAVVDPHDSSNNSSSSIATVSITAVNDAPILQTSSGSTGLGLAATYYINSWDLTGATYRRIDTTVNFGNNFAVPGYNDENFSVRWTGQVKAPVGGDFIFTTVSDDGVRLWVDDTLIIDNWTLHGDATDVASAITFETSSMHDIRMEFYERGGGETARLYWSYPGQSTQIIPVTYLFPATTRPAMSYVNGSSAVIIDDALTITDVDSAYMATATVSISTNYQSGQDTLQFTDQNGITGSYSAGVYALSGSSTVANYKTALRSVRYYNSSGSPNTSTRTIVFSVSDGAAASNETYRNITFTGTNTAPVITEGTSTAVIMDEDATPTAFSLTLNATDADYQSISWSVTTTPSHGTATVSSTGDSITVGYAPTADYYGSDSFVVQASDGAGGTDTITVNVTIRDKTAPIISSIAINSTPTVTWATDEAGSSKIAYSITTSYASSTAETDTSPRVTSHSVSLLNLLSCTTYNYVVVSTDASTNVATSTNNTFTSTGCAADAVPSAVTSTAITTSAGGSASMTSSSAGITVSVPANAVSSSASVVIQVKSVASSGVLDSLGRPERVPREVGTTVFDVKAIINNTIVLDSFDAAVTITYTYSDSDIAGLNESSLVLYHYHSGAWSALSGCSIDAGANTITCTTQSFSIFALFGQRLATTSNNSGASYISSVPSITYPGGTVTYGALQINSNAARTGNILVTLNIFATNTAYMTASEDPTFTGASYQPFVAVSPFRLSSGMGTKIVYVKLLSLDGGLLLVSDEIVFDGNETIDTSDVLSCTATLYLTKPIRLGYKNNPADVRLLESFLNTYEQAGLVVDGVYSQQDFDTVVRWQEKNAKDILLPWGIAKGTGYIYTTSLAKIKQIHEAKCAASPAKPVQNSVTTGVCLNTATTLYYGMQSALVTDAQKLLARASYFTQAQTGFFGVNTRDAVLRFQTDHGIKPVGYIGPNTRTKLNELACQGV